MIFFAQTKSLTAKCKLSLLKESCFTTQAQDSQLSTQDGFPKARTHAQCLQPCLTLRDPMDLSLPGSVHWAFLAKILEWVAMPSPPQDLLNPGTELMSPALQVDS